MFNIRWPSSQNALSEVKSVFGFGEDMKSNSTSLKYEDGKSGSNDGSHHTLHYTESTDVPVQSSRPTPAKKVSRGAAPMAKVDEDSDSEGVKKITLDVPCSYCMGIPDDLASTEKNKRNSLGSTANYSPLIARRDLASHPFSIPPSYHQNANLSHSHGSVDLSHLDLAQYTNQEEDQEEKKKRRSTGISLGEIDVVLRYNLEEDLLGVTVHSVGKFLVPSPSVIGEQWTLTPVTTMSLLPDKRRFFDCKHQVEVKDDTTGFLNIKGGELSGKTLRLTVFDSRRRVNHLSVGHALVPLKDLDPTGRITTYSKPLTCYSEPAGFNKGKVDLKVTWVVSAQKLELIIGRTYNIKSPRGVLGRDFFYKIFVYIRDVEYKTFKTSATRASPDVDFKEKFVIPLTHNQLKESSFLFCLYAKHFVKLTITSELVGSTMIGPYMANRSKALSQWEKMIMSPFEEVSENHTLYL